MGKRDKHPEVERRATSVHSGRAGRAQATSANRTKHGKEAVVRSPKASRKSRREPGIPDRDGQRSVLHAAESEAVSHSEKAERIELRTTPEMKALLQRAAAASKKNLTEFLIEAGANAAEETLANRKILWLDDAQWRDFNEILDRPATRRPRLAKLLAETGPLE